MTPARSFSCEFFPPKTAEGAAKLLDARRALATLGPEFFSVTFGAGGSTRDRTLDAVLEIQRDGHEAAPHLSCVGATRTELIEILAAYRAAGIRRIVALRGDAPSGSVGQGDLRYAAELVELIHATHGGHFTVEVACYPEVHPQARSAADDLRNFKRKIDAGAHAGITQYFYNTDAYFRFVDAAARIGVEAPIIPGVMPIGNFAQLARFSDACGAEIPRWLRMRLQGFADDIESIRAFGLDVVTDLCARLLAGGAPGLHFYTMNQAALTSTIWQRLGLHSAR